MSGPEVAAALREAAQAYLDAEAQPAYSWVIESEEARAEGRPNREVERMDRINAARRALLAALAGPSVVPGARPVRMSDQLFHQLGARRVEWGEPDDDGFYTPIVFTQDGQEHVS